MHEISLERKAGGELGLARGSLVSRLPQNGLLTYLRSSRVETE